MIDATVQYLGRVRLGSIRNKNNWNNASKRLFGSYSHSGRPGFHSGYSAPRSRIAGIYSGIHSYSGIFPNERALKYIEDITKTVKKKRNNLKFKIKILKSIGDKKEEINISLLSGCCL